MNLVRSEMLKIRTTNTWWIFGLVLLGLWGITLLANWTKASFMLDSNLTESTEGLSPDEVAEMQALASPVSVAADLYTNGQFFGVLVVMLLGAIVVTSEFFHQTVTTTFLTTPHRSAVVLAKLVGAAILGVAFWLLTTVLNVGVGALILGSLDEGSHLGDAAIWRAIGLNGLAYLLWAIFGVGFGVLIPNQIGAVVTGIVLYFAGYLGPAILFGMLAARFGDWIDNVQVLIPSIASQLMVSGIPLPGSPPQWVGAVVLIGYGVVTGVIGTLVMRRRDIS